MLRTLFTMVLLILASLAQADSRQVEVDVSVAAELKAGMTSDWPVYIYATAPGSRIPLASYATTLSALPLTVTLTEDMYVLPMFTLSGEDSVELVAKVSTTGDPHKTGPLDITGRSREVDLTAAQPVRGQVVIDQHAR